MPSTLIVVSGLLIPSAGIYPGFESLMTAISPVWPPVGDPVARREAMREAIRGWNLNEKETAELDLASTVGSHVWLSVLVDLGLLTFCVLEPGAR